MKIYIAGIGGIGISALARRYHSKGYTVIGSDKTLSKLTESLKKEGISVNIGVFPEKITSDIDMLVYSEALSESHPELQKAKTLGIKILRYNEALGEIVNATDLIAIAGTHGKSTTTSLLSLMFRNTNNNFFAIVGTLLKEFGGKNFYKRNVKTPSINKNFSIIEACEYKRHFLEYRPYIAIITNIELDHADYFHNESDYVTAFIDFIKNIKSNGYLITSPQVYEKLTNYPEIGNLDIHIAILDTEKNNYLLKKNNTSLSKPLPKIELQVPGKHIYYDAQLASIAADIVGLHHSNIEQTLSAYSGVWRRMEIIGYTKNNNLIISDYAHHPTEITATLKAIKNHYKDKKIITIFQPHQYSRTIELFDDFILSFDDTDIVIIPNIYESRDSEESKKSMSAEIFASSIQHQEVYYTESLDKTLPLIDKLDAHNISSAVFILMGAGDIDNLREKIKLY